MKNFSGFKYPSHPQSPTDEVSARSLSSSTCKLEGSPCYAKKEHEAKAAEGPPVPATEAGANETESGPTGNRLSAQAFNISY